MLTPWRYILFFIICVCIFSSFYLPYLLFLKKTGEYKSAKEIVNIQLLGLKNHQKIVYGSGIHGVNYYYKKALLDQIQPKIVALGSSRVMQFRQKMFSTSFINMGGSMNSINAGLRIYKDILKLKPQLIILGVDVWWFNEKFQKTNYKETFAAQQYKPQSGDFENVKNWLQEGKLSYKDLFAGIFNFSIHGLGVAGFIENDGFAADGSYYYTSIITGKKKHHDIGFSDTLMRISKGERRFEYNQTISEEHYNNLKFLLDEFKKNNIELILFFPPLAETVGIKMNEFGTRYAYINQLKTKLSKDKYKYFDYTDPQKIGSSDCEFIDGFHGGDVTYARILLTLAKQSKKLANLLNLNYLNKAVQLYKGAAFIPDQQISLKKEVDFLALGCKK